MNKHILRFANLAGVILLSIFAFTLSDIIIDKYNLKNYFLYYFLLLGVGVSLILLTGQPVCSYDEENEYA